MIIRWISLVTLIGAFYAHADAGSFKFSYRNSEIGSVIDDYAKLTGQRFVYDNSIKGRVNILNPDKISKEEAFAQLSSALATQGYGISEQDGVMLVQLARNLQRSLIGTGTSLPSLRPERMYTWIVKLKYAKADQVNRELRILLSKDGELSVNPSTNQLIITDWVSNLHRVQKILEAVDIASQK